MELIGEDCRLDHQYAIFMARGHVFAGGHALHNGGVPFDGSQSYQVREGRIHSGLTVVSFALSDAPSGAGGFCCIPGSHKSRFPLPEGWDDLEEPTGLVQQVPMAAGDALIFTEAITHGCLPWSAAHERRSLLFKYCPGYMQWERNSPFVNVEAYDWNERQRKLLRPPYAGRRDPIDVR